MNVQTVGAQLALGVILLASCGGGGSEGDDDGGLTPPPAVDPGGAADEGCAAVFRQENLPTYYVDIAPAEWEAMQHEFLDRVAIEATGADYAPYHPIEFRYDDNAQVPGVMIRLKGQSSWKETIAFDADPKMQFVISFNEVDSHGRFMGMRKLELDMPRTDASFLRQRLALYALRANGVPAQCANSARLVINGEYYGLYTNIERLDKEYLERVFPGADGGDLWKGGRIIKTNEETFSWDRLEQFWHGTETVAELETITDLPASVREWAAEAVVPHGDGYYNGRANFFLYDHPTRGFIWLAHDLDAAFDYLPPDTSPIYPPCMNQTPNDRLHYTMVMSDAAWQERYVDALREANDAYDAADLQHRAEQWSAQIADAASHDPHRSFGDDIHDGAVDSLIAYPAKRKAAVDAWLGCRSGGGADADGDGFDFCHDCADNDGAMKPGVAETCNGLDDDCNGISDDLECP